MLYFLPWVAILLLSILAIPIASMMDKRKAEAAYASASSDDGGGNGGNGGGFDGIDDGPLVPLDGGEEPVSPIDDAADGLSEDGVIELPQDSVEAFGSGEGEF